MRSLSRGSRVSGGVRIERRYCCRRLTWRFVREVWKCQAMTRASIRWQAPQIESIQAFGCGAPNDLPDARRLRVEVARRTEPDPFRP